MWEIIGEHVHASLKFYPPMNSPCLENSKGLSNGRVKFKASKGRFAHHYFQLMWRQFSDGINVQGSFKNFATAV